MTRDQIIYTVIVFLFFCLYAAAIAAHQRRAKRKPLAAHQFEYNGFAVLLYLYFLPQPDRTVRYSIRWVIGDYGEHCFCTCNTIAAMTEAAIKDAKQYINRSIELPALTQASKEAFLKVTQANGQAD